MFTAGVLRPGWGLALAALMGGCGGRDATRSSTNPMMPPPPDARASDGRDDPLRLPAHTSWTACGLVGQPPSAWAVVASPDGRYLAASAQQSWVWDLRDLSLVHMIATDGGIKPGFSRDASFLSLAGDGRYLFRMSDGAEVATYDLGLGGCDAWSSALAISPDNTAVALGNCSSVEIRTLEGQLVRHLASQVWSPGVAYSPDGRWLATSGPELWRADGDDRIWPDDLISGPQSTAGDASERFNDNTVAFSPDGKTLLVSNASINRSPSRGFDVRTQLLRVTDGAVVRDFGHALSRRPSFSPDGSWIAAGSQVVHLGTDQRTTLDSSIQVSTFLADGRIAGIGEDDRVRLFCPSRP